MVGMLSNWEWLRNCQKQSEATNKSAITRLVLLRLTSASPLSLYYKLQRVDIIYIGTPNTSHFPDALAALQAGKHCLLEKPATLNAREWKTLSALAKDKGLFLMEGKQQRTSREFFSLC